jgi:hypothetical protein
MQKATKKAKAKPVKRTRRRKGPDLASMSIGELRRELERRCAICDGAPLPEELVARAAAERERVRRSCGVYVVVEALDLAGVSGDYLRYTAVILSSGPLEKRELKDALASLERPLPNTDSEPSEKLLLRRFRKGA